MRGADPDPGGDDVSVLDNCYRLFTMLQPQFYVPHMHRWAEHPGGGHQYCSGLKTKAPRAEFPRAPAIFTVVRMNGVHWHCLGHKLQLIRRDILKLPKVAKVTSRWLSSRVLIPDHCTLPYLLCQDFG